MKNTSQLQPKRKRAAKGVKFSTSGPTHRLPQQYSPSSSAYATLDTTTDYAQVTSYQTTVSNESDASAYNHKADIVDTPHATGVDMSYHAVYKSDVSFLHQLDGYTSTSDTLYDNGLSRTLWPPSPIVGQEDGKETLISSDNNVNNEPRLQHDINFDPTLHFRPNLDSGLPKYSDVLPQHFSTTPVYSNSSTLTHEFIDQHRLESTYAYTYTSLSTVDYELGQYVVVQSGGGPNMHWRQGSLTDGSNSREGELTGVGAQFDGVKFEM